MIYSTRGIVIKKTDMGEADQLFTLYTKDFGKIKILGRGIRKIKAKLRGHMELFNYSRVFFAPGRNFPVLTGAETINVFFNIRSGLSRISASYYFAELVDKFIGEYEKDGEIWQLVSEGFKVLNSSTMLIPHPSFLRYFEFNLLKIIGYGPELYRCIICQKRLPAAKLFFSPKLGGVVCNECSKKVDVSVKKAVIKPNTIKILRLMEKQNFSLVSRIKLSSRDNSDLNLTLRFLLDYISGEKINSLDFLNEVGYIG